LVSDEPIGLSSLSSPCGPMADVPRPEGSTPVPSVESKEARIRRMFETHFDPLWRFMRRLGVAQMDLDDALQEVVVIAANRLADIPLPSERSFLFGTAFRVASEHRRRRTSRHEVGDEELARQEDPAPEPDAFSDQVRARALLDEVLAVMPTDLRAVFTLYEIEELTMVEISELLGVPLGTVASRLRRAREQFEARIHRLQVRAREVAAGSIAQRQSHPKGKVP
jgi:RNA polymerase sigma-70 factor (ECF subfamily)